MFILFVPFSEPQSFWRLVSPALVGALVGAMSAAFISGWLLQKYFMRKANQAKLVDMIVEELEQLREDSFSYWMIDLAVGSVAEKKKATHEARIYGEKMKAAIVVVAGDLSTYKGKYDRSAVFAPLVAVVTDACTGGKFETHDKAPDPSRYLLIINAIGNLKADILQRKV